MLGAVGKSKRGPRITEPAAPQQQPILKRAGAGSSGASKPAATAKPDAYTKAGGADRPRRKLGGGGKKADKASFLHGAHKSKAGKAGRPKTGGEVSGRQAADKADKAGVVRAGPQKAGYSVPEAVGKISDLFSGQAGVSQAREATGILRSFKDGKDLGSVMSGIQGKTLQSLLVESGSRTRSSLVGHVARHGDQRAKDVLAGGIRNEIDRIDREGTSWIKHPVPRPGTGRRGGAPGRGGSGTWPNPRIEKKVRGFELLRLMAKSGSGGSGGDGGRGPIG